MRLKNWFLGFRTLRQAQAARNKGDFVAAAELYRSYLSLAPYDWANRIQMANCLKDSRQFNAAEDAYHEVLRQFPKAADAYRQLGHLMYDQGDLDKSQRFFIKARELDPSLHIEATRFNQNFDKPHDGNEVYYDKDLRAVKERLLTLELDLSHLRELCEKSIERCAKVFEFGDLYVGNGLKDFIAIQNRLSSIELVLADASALGKAMQKDAIAVNHRLGIMEDVITRQDDVTLTVDSLSRRTAVFEELLLETRSQGEHASELRRLKDFYEELTSSFNEKIVSVGRHIETLQGMLVHTEGKLAAVEQAVSELALKSDFTDSFHDQLRRLQEAASFEVARVNLVDRRIRKLEETISSSSSS